MNAFSLIQSHAKRQWLKVVAAVAALASGWLAAKGYAYLTEFVVAIIVALGTGLFELAASKASVLKVADKLDEVNYPAPEVVESAPSAPPVKVVPRSLPEILSSMHKEPALVPTGSTVVQWNDPDYGTTTRTFADRYSAVMFKRSKPPEQNAKIL